MTRQPNHRKRDGMNDQTAIKDSSYAPPATRSCMNCGDLLHCDETWAEAFCWTQPRRPTEKHSSAWFSDLLTSILTPSG